MCYFYVIIHNNLLKIISIHISFKMYFIRQLLLAQIIIKLASLVH